MICEYTTELPPKQSIKSLSRAGRFAPVKVGSLIDFIRFYTVRIEQSEVVPLPSVPLGQRVFFMHFKLYEKRKKQ